MCRERLLADVFTREQNVRSDSQMGKIHCMLFVSSRSRKVLKCEMDLEVLNHDKHENNNLELGSCL